MQSAAFKYKWYGMGDIGGAATIVFDNLTVLTFISLILQYGYSFPTNIILHNIIPGTVIGVIVGNLLGIILSFKLAYKNQRNVTAMPIGLDTPSGIGLIVCVVGPAFSLLKQQGMDVNTAAISAWHLGVGCVFLIAIIKFACSFFAHHIKNIIPSSALLGAMGGVAIAIIGFSPLVTIFANPIVGLVSLSVLFLTLFAKVRLPFNFSALPAAVILGVITHYSLLYLGLIHPVAALAIPTIHFLAPSFSITPLINLHQLISYVSLAIPFALLVIFGSMSALEAAIYCGENYEIRELMLIDSIASFAGACFGGIGQTTPYAGFAAYKKIDARAGYLLINTLLIGIGGLFGLVGIIVNIVPGAAVAPVLLYVAFEIAAQGFIYNEEHKYIVPLLIAIFPSIARLVQIQLTDGSLISVDKLQAQITTVTTPIYSDHLSIILLGNGFIITGVLWASLLCFLIDNSFIKAAVCSVILSIFSYFGIIHSIYISGQMYLPWQLPTNLATIPTNLALAYLALGVIVLLPYIFIKPKPNNKLL